MLDDSTFTRETTLNIAIGIIELVSHEIKEILSIIIYFHNTFIVS